MALKCRFGWLGEALGGNDRWVGLVSQSVPNCGEHRFAPTKPIWVYQGAFVAALPAQRLASLTASTSTSQQLATSGTAGRRFSV